MTAVSHLAGAASRSHRLDDGYIVQSGDNLTKIARRHGISLEALARANPQIRDLDLIRPGQRITIPEGRGGTYVVQGGDNLWAIARTHGVALRDLLAANPQAARQAFIFPGDRLIIPGAEPRVRRGVSAGADVPATRRTDPTQATGGAQAGSTPGLDLRAIFDPARGSAALGAIIIGQAEGTRTPSGGFRDAYYRHIDPGNGVVNRGSFSAQHATHLTPEQADVRELTRLQGQVGVFEAAARRAGVNADNAQLATAYLDLYNQSPTAAARFLDQLDYVRTAGVSTDSMTELRFRSFVDVRSGERFRFASGTPAGGGFANIARQNLGRAPTEAEVQAVIRADQARRVRAMAAALPNVTAPAAPAPARPPVPVTVGSGDATPRFTHNRGLDLPAAVVRQANELSDAVRARTGYGIHVTSGQRSPARQALAMYNNFVERDSPRYANRQAFAEIQGAYDEGRRQGLGREATVARMTAVIEAQVDRGVFISRHMSSGALDIRTPPASQRAEIMAAIRNHPSVQSVGAENDHLHIQFR